MAKQKKTATKKPPARLPLRFVKHLKTLGMTESAYIDWCWDNGFIGSTSKTPVELEAETSFHQALAIRYKDLDRSLKNPRQLIRDACAGKINPHELTRLKWSEFCRVVAQSNCDPKKRKQLEELLLHVNKHGDFLFERITLGDHIFHYVEALIQLNYRRDRWIRPLKDWKPGIRNRQRQFASLARHLLAKYPVPNFMDSAWFRMGEGTRKYRDWFLLVGEGHNIRSAKKLPISLTKKMAHRFLEAPSHYSVEQAIRWGEVHALGGDQRLIETLLATRIGENFEHNEFWQSVIRFFINHPLLDRRHARPIIDYLQFQKFEYQEIMVAPEVVERAPPPYPQLTMQGRTPAALLRQVDDWHQDLHKSRNALGLNFKPSGITGWSTKPGKGKSPGWSIRELLTGSELIIEGKALNHCVASYADSCEKSVCSIWTMEKANASGTSKILTIEVTRSNSIVQVRGKNNRLATRVEFDTIKKWAQKSGLAIDRYLETEA